MDRKNLSYRRNCEGYFIMHHSLTNDQLFPEKEIIVRDTNQGYLEFPGGGVDKGETPSSALKREALEEAGVILKTPLKKIKTLKFIWDPDWAKTPKQKQRYEKYKGEEMHFFTAEVARLVNPPGDSTEKGWQGPRTMKISEAIQFLENSKPFPEDIKEYRETQIKILKSLKD